jgi:hypothetical protein
MFNPRQLFVESKELLSRNPTKAEVRKGPNAVALWWRFPSLGQSKANVLSNAGTSQTRGRKRASETRQAFAMPMNCISFYQVISVSPQPILQRLQQWSQLLLEQFVPVCYVLCAKV